MERNKHHRVMLPGRLLTDEGNEQIIALARKMETKNAQ